MFGKKFDHAPLLAPGRHVMSLAELEHLCVAPFSGNARQRREKLFYDLEICIQAILEARLPSDVIVNGSFLTEKPEPCDIDAKIYIANDLFDQLSRAQQILIANFNDPAYSKNLQIDVSPTYPRGHKDYGCAADLRGEGEDFGIEHAKQWLKGYAVLLVWETNVGLRIRR